MKGIRLCLLIGFVMFTQFHGLGWLHAQGNFMVTFGGAQLDYAMRVVRGPGNSFVVGGTSATITGNNDLCLMRVDLNGNLVWLKSYGNTGNDGGQSLRQLSDGGFALGGNSTSFSGTFDYYCIRTDAAGNLLWSKVISGPGVDQCNGVAETQGLGLALSGRSVGATEDILIVRFDNLGNQISSKRYDTGLHESGYNILQMPDLGFIGTGTYWLSGIGPTDNLIYRLDAAGNVLWAYAYGGAGDEVPFEILLGSDGFIYCAGVTNSVGAGNRDLFLMKLATDGTVQWTRTYGGSADDWGGYSLLATADGGFAIVGSSASFGASNMQCWLVKTNSNGIVQWSRNYGGTGLDYSYGLVETAPNEFLISGNTQSFAAGLWDMILVKTGVNGVTSCNSNSVNPASSAVSFTRTAVPLAPVNFGTDLNHTTVVTNGSLTRNVQCQVLPMEITNFQGQRHVDNILLNWRFEAEGNAALLQVERSMDGQHFGPIGSLQATSTSPEYTFSDTDPLPGLAYYRIQAMASAGSQNYSAIVEIAPSTSNALQLWPNPSTGIIHLSCEPRSASYLSSFSLYDLQGKTLLERSLNLADTECTMDLGDLPAGIYLVQLRQGNQTWRRNLVLK